MKRVRMKFNDQIKFVVFWIAFSGVNATAQSIEYNEKIHARVSKIITSNYYFEVSSQPGHTVGKIMIGENDFREIALMCLDDLSTGHVNEQKCRQVQFILKNGISRKGLTPVIKSDSLVNYQDIVFSREYKKYAGLGGFRDTKRDQKKLNQHFQRLLNESGGGEKITVSNSQFKLLLDFIKFYRKLMPEVIEIATVNLDKEKLSHEKLLTELARFSSKACFPDGQFVGSELEEKNVHVLYSVVDETRITYPPHEPRFIQNEFEKLMPVTLVLFFSRSQFSDGSLLSEKNRIRPLCLLQLSKDQGDKFQVQDLKYFTNNGYSSIAKDYFYLMSGGVLENQDLLTLGKWSSPVFTGYGNLGFVSDDRGRFRFVLFVKDDSNRIVRSFYLTSNAYQFDRNYFNLKAIQPEKGVK
jgi:hypothetical protein